MNLKKAIEIKQIDLYKFHHFRNPDLREADRLALEVMKREQILRHEIPYDREGLLPGETED